MQTGSSVPINLNYVPSSSESVINYHESPCYLTSYSLKKSKSMIHLLDRAYDFMDNCSFDKWMGNTLTMPCALRIILFLNYSFDKIGQRGGDKPPKANVLAMESRKLRRKWVYFYLTGWNT